MRIERIESFDGTELAVQVLDLPEDGTDETFVLANGLGGSISAWGPFISLIADRFRVVSFDYRGLYASGPPADPEALRIVDHREDLVRVLDHAGVESAVLCGWSMGVQVVLDFALAYPERVRALVLINGTAGDPFKTALGTEQSRWLIPLVTQLVGVAHVPFSAVVRMLAGLPFTPDAFRRVGLLSAAADLKIFGDLAVEFAELDWSVYMRTMREMGFHSVWDRLGDVTAPALVVGGTRDVMTPLAVSVAMAEKIPDSELLVLEGGTHYTPLEFPTEIVGCLDEFLVARRDRLG